MEDQTQKAVTATETRGAQVHVPKQEGKPKPATK